MDKAFLSIPLLRTVFCFAWAVDNCCIFFVDFFLLLTSKNVDLRVPFDLINFSIREWSYYLSSSYN